MVRLTPRGVAGLGQKMQIKSRAAAIENGDVTYFTGQPCKRGHVSARYVTAGSCVECLRENDDRRRERIQAVRRARADEILAGGS